MSEEPIFDPSLKKKKKAVAFNEDPLGAETDPTTPAPATIDNTTTSGEVVDMGPTTAHEMLQAAEKNKEGGEDDVKAMFGDLKKKKKKKEIPLDLDDDAPKKKKKEIPLDLEGADEAPKKKKKEIPLEGDEGTAENGADDGDDLNDFSELKKKKKSKKKPAFDMEAFEKELKESAKDGEDEDEDAPREDLEIEGDIGDDVFAQGEAPSGVESGSEAWLKSDRDYYYPELLTRFYSQLHAANPALLNSAGKRYTIAPPQLAREGNKKTIFTNISDICKRMHRQPEHVIQFMFSEMGTTGSVDGSARLVIKGRFQQKQIEHVLRRYIVEYVTCKTCKSPDTLLTKENRIFFMSCESCGSRRSVNTIKSGFQAQVGRRKKAV
jgi:translation initiation factor 2 subunit 2